MIEKKLKEGDDKKKMSYNDDSRGNKKKRWKRKEVRFK